MEFTCPNAKRAVQVADEEAGKPFRCPACSEMHVAPAAPAAPSLQPEAEPDAQAASAARPADEADATDAPTTIATGSGAAGSAAAEAEGGLPPPLTASYADQETAPGGEQPPSGPAGGPVEEQEQPSAPRRPRRVGRVAVAVIALAGIAAGTGLYIVPVVRARTTLEAALLAADEHHGEGRFREACEAALRAEGVVEKTGYAFTAAERETYARRIARHKSAFETYGRAEAAAGEAAKRFESAVAELERLIARARSEGPEGDAALAEALARMLGRCAAEQAERLAATEGEAVKTLAALRSLRERMAGVADEGERERLAGAKEKVVDGELGRIREGTYERLRDVLELLGGEEPGRAFVLVEKREDELHGLPEEFRRRALGEYEELLAGLASGRPGGWDGPLGLKEQEGRTALAHFASLRPVMREALEACERGASDPGKAEAKLKELRGKTAAQAGKVADAAAALIDSYAGEVKGVASAYGEARKNAASGNHEALLTGVALGAATSSPRVRFRMGWIRTWMLGFEAELRVDAPAGPAASEGPGRGEAAIKVKLSALKAAYGHNMTVSAAGYDFVVPWGFAARKSILHVADTASAMRESGVDPKRFSGWRLAEGPGLLMAAPIAGGGDLPAGGERYFLDGEMAEAETPARDTAPELAAFREAAAALRERVKADEAISAELRQAFDPVLGTAYGEVDYRDLLDPDFCRRIIADGYLEDHIPGAAERLGDVLARYREAYGRLSALTPVFTLRTGAGRAYSALRSLEEELRREQPGAAKYRKSMGLNPDSDHVYSWRIVESGGGRTAFVSPLPQRQIHPLYLRATYEGRHDSPPAGAKPVRVEVVHVTEGVLAACDTARMELEADGTKWNEALASDSPGPRNEVYGEPGWSLPPHVPFLGRSGKAEALLTRQGLLGSPGFGEIESPEERRAAEDRYLDECAAKLVTPGELGLFFRHFTMYVLDSSIAAVPTLLGSHIAMGETHQTAYELLDRKVGDVYVGDCDDIAEFYQVVTRRQGKLSHVFSLPRHAACGYVEDREPPPGKGFALFFLQTGPPLAFRGKTLDEVVEASFRHFSRDEEEPNFTVASVPFLFRFAGEQTRTPYWLSDRILVDWEYAELMIRVQSYWHYHYYATAMRTMEEVLRTDKDISNYVELSGLYSFVGLFDKAVAMSRAGLEVMKRKDPKVRVKELVDIASFHHRAGDDDLAIEVLDGLSKEMLEDFEKRRWQAFIRLMPVRLMAGHLYADMARPVTAFKLIQRDAWLSERMQGKLIDNVRRAVMAIHGALRKKAEDGKDLTPEESGTMKYLEQLIAKDLAANLFEEDDSFNDLLRKYATLGSFAISRYGREAARKKLPEKGPYPTAEKDHTKRGEEITEEDWVWFRICSRLYMVLAEELADPKEKKKYDPETATALIDAMLAAEEAGWKLGSMNAVAGVIVRGRILRAALKNDVAEFDRVFAMVRSKEWSRHFDDACTAFGHFAGIVPLEDFGKWMDVFHKHIEGRHHYFKVAYRSADKKNYDHSLVAAEKSVAFFPDVEAMALELRYMRDLVKELRAIQAEKERRKKEEKSKKQQEEEKQEEGKEEPPPADGNGDNGKGVGEVGHRRAKHTGPPGGFVLRLPGSHAPRVTAGGREITAAPGGECALPPGTTAASVDFAR